MKKYFFLFIFGLLLVTCSLSLATAVHAGGPGFASYIRTQSNRGYFNTDGTDDVTATVVVISETTTKISGQYVTLYTSRGAMFDTGSGSSKLTNNAGEATFTIRSTTPGELNLYAVCMGETLYPNLLNNASLESLTAGTSSTLYWTGVGGAVPP